MVSNFLVTGGLGYIGSHISIDIIERGDNVIIVDNLVNSKISVLEKLKLISRKSIKFYNLDINNSLTLDKVFKENQIDHVIHLAAYKSVQESISYPNKYYENNIISLLSVLNCMLNNNVNNLIFSSSACVYSKSNSYPVKENGLITYENTYSHTKILCENLIEKYVNLNENLKAISLRYFNPIGSHPSGLIGDFIGKYSTNIIPSIVKSLKNNNTFKIYGDDYNTEDGFAIRDFIHILDLSIAHLDVVGLFSDDSRYSVYNVGTGTGTSVKKLFDYFCKYNNLNIGYEICKKRNGDIPVSIADVTKINTDLNWFARKSIEEMVIDSYNFYRLNT